MSNYRLSTVDLVCWQAPPLARSAAVSAHAAGSGQAGQRRRTLRQEWEWSGGVFAKCRIWRPMGRKLPLHGVAAGGSSRFPRAECRCQYGDTSDHQRGEQARDGSAGIGMIMYVTETWPPALFATLSQRSGPVFAALALALAAALFLDLGGRAMWSTRRERS